MAAVAGRFVETTAVARRWTIREGEDDKRSHQDHRCRQSKSSQRALRTGSAGRVPAGIRGHESAQGICARPTVLASVPNQIARVGA
jgi:hypothetical protein